MRLVQKWRYTEQMTLKELGMRCRCSSAEIDRVCNGHVSDAMLRAIERAYRSRTVPVQERSSVKSIRFLDRRLGYFSSQALDLGLNNVPTRAERSRMEIRILYAETLYLEYRCRRKLMKLMTHRKRSGAGWFLYDRWNYGKWRAIASRR